MGRCVLFLVYAGDSAGFDFFGSYTLFLLPPFVMKMTSSCALVETRKVFYTGQGNTVEGKHTGDVHY